MSTKRHKYSAATDRNEIYAFGGFKIYDCNLSSAQVYDFTSQDWSDFLDMKMKRSGRGTTAVGNKINIIRGSDGSIRHSSGEVFDITTNTWSSIPKVMEQKFGCAAVSIGNRLYFTGDHNGYVSLSSSDIRETITDTSSSPRQANDGRERPQLQKSVNSICREN